MKRVAAVFLWLITAVLLLSGCRNSDNTVISCQDLTLTLPGEFLDLSSQSYAQDTDFLYGQNTLIILGFAEEKAVVNQQTLAAYTQQILDHNQLSCAPEIFADGYVFSYEAAVGDMPYSYLTATFQGNAHYFTLQCYCPSADLPAYQETIDQILQSIHLNGN